MSQLSPITSSGLFLAGSPAPGISSIRQKISSKSDLTKEEVSSLNDKLHTKSIDIKREVGELILALSEYQYKALGVNGDNRWKILLADSDSNMILLGANIAGGVTKGEGVYRYFKSSDLENVWKNPSTREVILPVIVGFSRTSNKLDFSAQTTRDFISLALDPTISNANRDSYLTVSASLVSGSKKFAGEFLPRFLELFLNNPELRGAAHCCSSILTHNNSDAVSVFVSDALERFFVSRARDESSDQKVVNEIVRWSGKYKPHFLPTLMHSQTAETNKAKLLQSMSRTGVELPIDVLLELNQTITEYKDLVVILDSAMKGQMVPEQVLSGLVDRISIHRGSTFGHDKMALAALAKSQTPLSHAVILQLDSMLSGELLDARFQGSVLTRDILDVILAHGALPQNTTRIVKLCIGDGNNSTATEIYRKFGQSIEKILANHDFALKCAKLLKSFVVDKKRIRLTDNLRGICERAIEATSLEEIKEMLGLVVGKESTLDTEALAIRSIGAIANPSSRQEATTAITNILTSVRRGHQLTDDECLLLENVLKGETSTVQIQDKKNISLIFSIDIMRRKNSRNLQPQTIEAMCGVISSEKCSFGVRREVLRNLNYMLSRGSKSVQLQMVSDTFAKLLSDSNPGIQALARIGFRYFTTHETGLNIDTLTNSFISHITRGKISDDAFNLGISSLESLVNRGEQIEEEGLATLFRYAVADNSSSEDPDIINAQKVRAVAAVSVVHKALEFDAVRAMVLNHAVSSRGPGSHVKESDYTQETPQYITAVMLNLLDIEPETAAITLRIMNLYTPTEAIAYAIPQGLIEAVIDDASGDKMHHLKNEACVLLANIINQGYEPHPILGCFLSETFEYDTPGELVLLRNAMISGGFIPTDEMIYGLSDIVANADNVLLVGTAIATLMTALEARAFSDEEAQAEAYPALDYLQIASDIESALELEDKSLFPIIDEALEVLNHKYGVPIVFQETNEVGVNKAVLKASLVEGSEQESTGVVAASSGAVPKIRTQDEILDNLQSLNASQENLQDVLNPVSLKEKLDKVSEYGERFREFDRTQISSWAASKGKSASIEEVIAIIDRANEIVTDGHRLRDTQIISSLLLLEAKEQGRLAQVKTGEGKTKIVAAIAIAKAFRGQKVDIITSSPILAERDAASTSPLYEMFGLTCSHNIQKDYKEGLKSAYESDIVYGDASTFQHDYLRHEYSLLNTRGGRRFEDSFAIVDEVDSMMLDEKDKIAKIASHAPGMEYLIPLYSKIWLEVTELYAKSGGKIEDRDDFKAKIEEHSRRLIAADIVEGKIGIPKHLRGFARMQISDWAESSILALEFKENRDYVIAVGEDGRRKISPVDHANTGTTRINTAWQNGLHQFLQLKHSLAVSAENFTSAYISNMGYFKLYGSNLSGLTGTLGSKESVGLLEEVYEVDTVKVPTFAESRLNTREDHSEDYLAKDTEDWAASIVSNLNKEINENGRAALVLCETIEESMQVASILEATNIGEKITLYTRSDVDDADSLTSRINPGEIIVATNLAGRGTDIITSEEIESRGGLHVAMTFMPRNQRVEDQGIGRTARQGRDGSSIIIVNKEVEKEKWQVSDIASIGTLRDLRDTFESASTEYVKHTKIPKLVAEDELFHEFQIFAHEMMRSQGDNADHAYSNFEIKWGMWLKSHLRSSVEGFESTKLKAAFGEFKAHIKAEYTKIEDPVSLARMGYDQVSVGNYKASYGYYLDAIKKDPDHGFIAAYNMAYAVIRDNNTHSQRYDGVAVNMAMNYLDKADVNIDKVITNLASMKIEVRAANPEEAENTELLEQIEAKIEILKLQKQYIGRSKHLLGQIKPTHRVGIDGYTKLQDIVPDIPIHKAVALEFNQAGLHIFYDLGARPAPRDPGPMIVGMVAATVAAPFTAGLSASLFGASTISGAAFAGMTTSLVGTFGSNLYSNKGRIDLAFRDSTKAKSVRAAALDGLSAGMFAGAVKGLKIEGFKNLSKTQKVTRMAQHEAIKAGIGTTLHRGDLKTNLKRGLGNAVMQSASLTVAESFASSGGFQRGVANTAVQTVMGVAMGREAASTAIGSAVGQLTTEADVKLVGGLELQDFGSTLSALAVVASGGDAEQVADAVSAYESVKFTRGLVKDDIREDIARGEHDTQSTSEISLGLGAGVAAGDSTAYTGSIGEEVREELELEKLERQVINSKALEKRKIQAEKERMELEEFKKDELRIQLKREAEYYDHKAAAGDVNSDSQKYAIAKAEALRKIDTRLGEVKLTDGERIVQGTMALVGEEARISPILNAYGRMVSYALENVGELTDRHMPWLKSEGEAIASMGVEKIGDFARSYMPSATYALATGAEKLGETKTTFYETAKLSVGEQVIADTMLNIAMIEVGTGAVKLTGQIGTSAVQGVREARSLRSARKISPTIKASAINKNAIEWVSPTGTKQTYKVYQRTDIDWNMVRTSTKGDKKFLGKTNREAAKAGLAPELTDTSFATLHHINQDGLGKLVEASTRYHGAGKYGQKQLHSIWGTNKPHPTNTVDRPKFKQDTKAYWKERVSNE